MHKLVTFTDGLKVMLVGGEEMIGRALEEAGAAVTEALELSQEQVTFGGHVVPYYYVRGEESLALFVKEVAESRRPKAPEYGLLEKTLVMSLAHIPQSVRDWLDVQARIRAGLQEGSAELVVDLIGANYGFRIGVQGESDGIMRLLTDQENPNREPLRLLVRYARREKVDWLALDRDVEPSADAFKVYQELDPL